MCNSLKSASTWGDAYFCALMCVKPPPSIWFVFGSCLGSCLVCVGVRVWVSVWISVCVRDWIRDWFVIFSYCTAVGTLIGFVSGSSWFVFDFLFEFSTKDSSEMSVVALDSYIVFEINYYERESRILIRIFCEW